ncbi:MAG: GntP family permease [FCB group bacterium]|nr:GntP family permease [FCB group bacterium]MBL7121154.1 GntP family permease [Candidatus Neomarinimicrobiota bacterium]
MIQILLLLASIAFIILGTTRLKLHPFLTLLGAGVFLGLFSGLSGSDVLTALSTGFGKTLAGIGIVITLGSIIGTYLEKNGGAKAIASALLRAVGEKRSPLAINLTGAIVSIPVFCDSGFVILSTLNKALSKKTGIPLIVFAIALATGLYTTHVFVPPTPGPLAAAAALDADLGLVMLLGIAVSIPVTLAGWLWAIRLGKQADPNIPEQVIVEEEEAPSISLLSAIGPILLPILLIAMKSLADYPSHPLGENGFSQFVSTIGHPVMALFMGVILAMTLGGGAVREQRFEWVGEALKSAGIIILITGAGGAFGSVLRASGIADFIGDNLVTWNLGLFLPFFLAAMLKTAQGSSTVSIITTAALMASLLDPLGLTSPVSRALVVLAIGAGAMTVSHVNDSYFWVVSQFSGLDTRAALRGHTLGSLVLGVTGFTIITLISWIF